MLETVFFRLMLVGLAAVVVTTASLWAFDGHREAQAREAVARSFDDYNRYLEACGNDNEGLVWDLARKARSDLDRATMRRDAYQRRRDAWAWLGAGLGLALIAGFYALRWAITGRIRPLWLLARGGGDRR
jgi:hypothetical protein